METSKIIILISYLISVSLTVVVIVATFMGFDVEGLVGICLSSYAEVSASNIWYYKKAQRENVLKIAKSLGLENNIDINQLIN